MEVGGVQRRTLRVLVIGQLLAGAGLAAGVTVGALIAEDLLGSVRLSGLPAGLFTLGSASSAVLVGQLSQRFGRRPGLATGYAAAGVGAAGVVLATVLESVPLLLVGLLVYGAGSSTSLQARYAGGDLAEPGAQGRAISMVLFATTFGAVAGPNLVGPTGQVAEALGLPRLAGPFLLAGVAYGLSALVLTVWLRPDPLLTARALAKEPAEGEAPVVAEPHGSVMHGAVTMVLTQLVMVAVMTMTPVHMHAHGHGLSVTGIVISVHIAGMFLPSPLTGRLIDRHGPHPAVVGAVACLLGTGLLVALATPTSVVVLALALGLLGLGWNLGLLAGTTMVAMATTVEERAGVQGRLDGAVALAGATGGLSSGLVVSATSYPTLAVAGGVLALLLLPVVARTPRERELTTV